QVHPYDEGRFVQKAPGAGDVADVVADEYVLALGPLPAQRVLAVLVVPGRNTQATRSWRSNVSRYAVLEGLVGWRLSGYPPGAKQHTYGENDSGHIAHFSPSNEAP